MYSDKQRHLLKLWQDGRLRRINILQGSVRSGKTWISLVLWAFWVATMPTDSAYLMVAKTLTSLRRNCLDLLQSLVGTAHFTYSIPKKEAQLFGRTVYLEGASDARAESKIRGMTLQGAYIDELTQIPEDFFIMLLSRLSDKGARLIGTTNPDVPTHWLKENYLDRSEELDLLALKFTIDNNPFLDPEYVENIKREYTGAFYSRFIEGDWVRAEGLIYPMFNRAAHTFNYDFVPPSGTWYEYVISLDYGTTNPTSSLLWCISGGVAYCLGEYYHDGRKDEQLTDEEHIDNLRLKLLTKIPGPLYQTRVIVDPSAASLKTCLRRSNLFRPLDADNNVLDGLRNVASALQNNRIIFHESCVNTIREFQIYGWDDSCKNEEPLKENDHCMDAVRYYVRTYLLREIRAFNDELNC